MGGNSSLTQPAPLLQGSSVPVSIPGMLLSNTSARTTGAAEGKQEREYTGTFIPPHQLSQHAGFMFSLTGTISPNSLLKRDRLKMRNAVLQSTGFLEAQHATDKLPVEVRHGHAARRRMHALCKLARVGFLHV